MALHDVAGRGGRRQVDSLIPPRKKDSKNDESFDGRIIKSQADLFGFIPDQPAQLAHVWFREVTHVGEMGFPAHLPGTQR